MSAAVGALQRWFQATIMHEQGARSVASDRRVKSLLPPRARSLEDLLEPSRELSAHERLDVYADSYFLRLRDIMQGEYPGLVHALGEASFSLVVREYLTRHPSTSFTLSALSARFPGFLARRARTPAVARRRTFLSELAALERAVEEVFDERLAPAVDVKRLRSIAPPEWGGARFTLNPALRLLATTHPVNDYLQAVYDGKSPRVPAPRPSWVVVYRKEWRSWRARLTREQFTILAALRRGRPLGAALKQALATRGGAAALPRLHDWFHEWTSEGLFTAITLPR